MNKGHFYQISLISFALLLISFFCLFLSAFGNLPAVFGYSFFAVSVITMLLSPRPFLFSPWFWCLLAFSFYFIFKSLYLYSSNSFSKYHELILYYGLFFLTTSFAFFMVLESLRGRIKYRPSFLLRFSVPRFPILVNSWMISVVIVVGITFLKTILVNVFGGGGSYLEKLQNTQNGGVTYVFWLLDLLYVIPFIFLLRKAELSRRWSKGCYLLMLAILVVDLVNFSRGAFVVHLLSFIFIYDAYIKRVNLLKLLAVSFGLLLVVVVFGVARSDLSGAASVFSAIEKISENTDLIFTLFFARLDAIDNAAMYLSIWDESVIYGKSLLASVTHAIPRAIWPDKPLLTAALITSITHPNEFSDGVNLYPTLVLEGIINFYTYGLFLYAFIFSIFLCFLHGLYKSECHQVKIVYMLLMTSSMNIFNEGFHSNAFSSFLFNAVLIVLSVCLIYKKPKVI